MRPYTGDKRTGSMSPVRVPSYFIAAGIKPLCDLEFVVDSVSRFLSLHKRLKNPLVFDFRGDSDRCKRKKKISDSVL